MSQVSFPIWPLVYKTAALVVVVASIVVASVAGYTRFLGETGAASTISTVSDDQRTIPKESVEAELLTIRPSGFEPSSIARPKGAFVLVIANRSGLDEVALRFERLGGSRIREANVSRKKPNWREVVDLPPGRYVLTESSHPDWNCEITIGER